MSKYILCLSALFLALLAPLSSGKEEPAKTLSLGEQVSSGVFPSVLVPPQEESAVPYKACVHTREESRPGILRSDQARTRRVLQVTGKELGLSTRIVKLLELVAVRESSLQMGLHHQLAADMEASASAFRRMREIYAEAGNPWVSMPERWGTYGLFGLISAYYLQRWDQKADPAVLCDPVVDIVVYVSVLQRAWKNRGPCQRGKITDLHRLASQGKVCPVGNRDALFERRARKKGIDLDTPVSREELGRALKTLEEKEEVVRRVWRCVEAEA